MTKRSHLRCSIKRAVLKNFAIFTGKHLYWSFFLTKFIKRRFQHNRAPKNERVPTMHLRHQYGTQKKHAPKINSDVCFTKNL